MRHTFHIATGQYEFIEQVFDGTAEDAVAAYKELQRAWKGEEGGVGLPQKQWNAWLDTYLSTGKPGTVEEWEIMSAAQKVMINEVKKSLARRKEN